MGACPAPIMSMNTPSAEEGIRSLENKSSMSSNAVTGSAPPSFIIILSSAYDTCAQGGGGAIRRVSPHALLSFSLYSLHHSRARNNLRCEVCATCYTREGFTAAVTRQSSRVS